jgi:hypothetical protein
LPADDHSGREVDHRGQVEPALTSVEVGDVTDQPLTWRAAGGEVPVDQVRRGDGLLAGDRGALVGTRLDRLQPEFAHQVGDQPDAALVAVAVQLSRHPAAARGLPGVVEDPLGVLGEVAPARLSRGLDPVAPGVETRPRHAQHPSHPGDLVGGLLRLDERAALGY